MRQGKYKDALKAFTDANKLSHNNCSACYVGLTFAYSNMGHGRAANENSKKAVETAARMPPRGSPPIPCADRFS